MHNDPRNLIVAINRAVGRKLSLRRFNDRLIIQKGCYILNTWGCGPEYEYTQFFRGPFSIDLDDDLKEVVAYGDTTDVSDSDVSRLSEIVSKGSKYVEAYSTLLMIKVSNPDVTDDVIMRQTLSLKPELCKEIMEASSHVLV